jgi:hypothetical protein
LSGIGFLSLSRERTFITLAARNIHRSGCSLRDVQLAGHSHIDGDTWAQWRLVGYV